METALSVFDETATRLRQLGFTIISEDRNRPWGGFFVIDEKQNEAFVKHFFPAEGYNTLQVAGKLSPKILFVAPGKRLSWQYHFRRAEIWRCMEGNVAVTTSDNDFPTEQKVLHAGDTLRLKQEERHRLIGMDKWGIVAEIWQHTDENNPSDEDDIIRLQDDFGR